jgi:diguanylate cyclase (GGDEF)-like protein
MGIVAINFRDYAYQNLEDKSKIIAEIVRDGLTAHMINGVMDKRSFFLQNISNSKDVESLWIVRSETVVQQFGEGYSSEHPRDDIDRDVLKEGETYRKIDETSQKVSLRVSVPYIASSYGNPNCLDCHNAKEGDVLGAISMTFDISDIRQLGAFTIAKILGTSVLFLILVMFATNYLIKPYLTTLESVRKVIQKAFQGDFSHRVTISKSRSDEAGEVARWLNTLFDKFQDTLGTIDHNISLFIPHNYVKTADPLEQSKLVIEELADIYKFKKTIELDRDKGIIYDRIFFVLKEKFKIKDFAFYEVNYSQNIRKLVYITQGRSCCEGIPDSDIKECRAYRTDAEVLSDEFHRLCPHFESGDRELHYFCTTFKINTEVGIIISATTDSLDELERIQKAKPLLDNYLEAAKPVLESKILMDILRESSLRDTLTGLYNRRFLEEFIDKATSQAIRSNISYSIMMIDIDFFKMVNDTYGHDVGDIVIRALGKVISSDIRNSDLAIRYGGEELVILLHNATEEGTMKVAEKIKKDFGDQKFKGGTETFQKTLSIGVSMFPSDADSIWKCIKFADIALYKAKEGGRNKILKFDTKMFPNGQDY